MSSTNFHILKSLHDSLIINVTRYISFNVYNQAIIHPLNVEQIMEQILILLTKRKKKKRVYYYLHTTSLYSLLLPTSNLTQLTSHLLKKKKILFVIYFFSIFLCTPSITRFFFLYILINTKNLLKNRCIV